MKGIILEINENKAVVFCKDGKIKTIAQKNYEIGQEININNVSYTKYLSAVACCVVCILMSVVGYKVYYTPISSIYVDINPSLRIDINRFDFVIDAVALNDDAKVLLSNCNIQGKKAEIGIEQIVEESKKENYINENNKDIHIDVISNMENVNKAINCEVENLQNKQYNVRYSNVSEEEHKQAIKLKVSVQKLRAIETYSDKTGETVEESVSKFQKTPTKEIYNVINETENKTATESTNVQSSNSTYNTQFEASVLPKKNTTLSKLKLQGDTAIQRANAIENQKLKEEQRKQKQEDKAERQSQRVEQKAERQESQSERQSQIAQQKAQRQEVKAERQTEITTLKVQQNTSKATKQTEKATVKAQQEEAKAQKQAEIAQQKVQQEEAKAQKQAEIAQQKAQREEAKAQKQAEIAQQKAQREEAKSQKQAEMAEQKAQREANKTEKQ